MPKSVGAIAASARRIRTRSSECGVKPPGKDINRPAVGVVAGVDDELIVEGDFRRGGQSVAVIGFDDLLGTGMREHSVTDEDAEASRIEKRLVFGGNSID